MVKNSPVIHRLLLLGLECRSRITGPSLWLKLLTSGSRLNPGGGHPDVRHLLKGRTAKATKKRGIQPFQTHIELLPPKNYIRRSKVSHVPGKLLELMAFPLSTRLICFLFFLAVERDIYAHPRELH